MKRCCRETFTMMLLAGMISACSPPGLPEPPPATLAVTHVTLIDGSGSDGQEDMTVLVDGDRIVAVGSAADLATDDSVPTVDGQGRFLIPGLWDLHVHLANNPEVEIAPERQLALYLAHGVVGVRDMGSDWQKIQSLRQQVAAGEIQAPEIVASGPYIDGPQEGRPSVLPVADAEAARLAVRSLAAMGVDFVKAQANLSRPAYLAVVDEARTIGLAVHGHIPDALTAAEVSDAGQRTIEHASPVLPSDAAILFSCSTREEELRREHSEINAARQSEGADPQELTKRYRALQLALVETYSEEKAEELFATLKEKRDSGGANADLVADLQPAERRLARRLAA